MSGEVDNQIGSALSAKAFTGQLGPTEHGMQEEVDNIASAIHARLHSTRKEVVAIGRDLLRAKALLKHGQWMTWLSSEFGMSPRSAENYMNVATRFGEKFESLSNLSLETAYKLAARSTPDVVIDAVLARASSGEGLSDSDAVAMLPKADRPLAAKPTSSAVAAERPSRRNTSAEPTTVAGQDAAPEQQCDPKSGEGRAATAVSPPEPVAPAPPRPSSQQVDNATLKAFEQLRILHPDRLRRLCPALRVCDPAALAKMLEVVLTEKTTRVGG